MYSSFLSLFQITISETDFAINSHPTRETASNETKARSCWDSDCVSKPGVPADIVEIRPSPTSTPIKEMVKENSHPPSEKTTYLVSTQKNSVTDHHNHGNSKESVLGTGENEDLYSAADKALLPEQKNISHPTSEKATHVLHTTNETGSCRNNTGRTKQINTTAQSGALSLSLVGTTLDQSSQDSYIWDKEMESVVLTCDTQNEPDLSDSSQPSRLSQNILGAHAVQSDLDPTQASLKHISSTVLNDTQRDVSNDPTLNPRNTETTSFIGKHLSYISNTQIGDIVRKRMSTDNNEK